MPTIRPGQLVEQINTERVWQIIRPDSATRTGTPRWVLRLEQLGPRDGDDRYVGMPTTASEHWLNTYCEDFRNGVDPPQGDGDQTVRYTIMDGTVGELVVETALEAIAQAKGWLEANEGFGQVEWYGWDARHDVAEPDLICTMVNGELEWTEPRVSV